MRRVRNGIFQMKSESIFPVTSTTSSIRHIDSKTKSKITKKIKNYQVSKHLNKGLKGLFGLQLFNDVITGFFVIVSDAEQEFAFERFEILVFSEEPLLPEHVNLVVDFVNDFFKGLIVELHADLK